jgi:sugar lactone lactonase YvrE
MADTDVLTDGLFFGEGPRWRDGRLWFSDFYDHAVKSVDLSGSIRTELKLEDQPSGLGWLPDGRLLVVSMRARSVLRLDKNGLAVHADICHLTAHLCNDMVVDREGFAWVGNFGFDLDAEIEDRGGEVFKTHPTANLVRVDPDGNVCVAAPDLHFPNGTVITADGATLIVAETLAGRLTAFTINADKSLSDRRTWAEIERAAPDGICLNSQNEIWVANAAAPEILRVAQGGEIRQRVTTHQPCYACMLGGIDGKTLFALTAASSDHRLASAGRTGRVETFRVNTPAAGWP